MSVCHRNQKAKKQELIMHAYWLGKQWRGKWSFHNTVVLKVMILITFSLKCIIFIVLQKWTKLLTARSDI